MLLVSVHSTWELIGRQHFLRCPTTKEWIRFSTYARRVRAFHAYDSGRTEASSGAYNLLSMQTRTLGHHILPNLHAIRWEPPTWDLMPFLRLFMNPGLVSVHIGFPDETPHLYHPGTISLIPTRDLEHLRLEGAEGGEGFLDALYNLLDCGSETLRSVYSDGELSVTVAEKLLQLPALRCLGVRLPEARISPPAVAFPSLEVLDVICTEPESWLHVLQNIPNPALRELDVTFMGSSPTCLPALGLSLFLSNIHQTLTSLACSFGGITTLEKLGMRLLPHFRWLAKLTLLSQCTTERCSVQLDDSIISELAVSLPQLTSLSLGGIPCEAATSDVTFLSLIALSSNCVDLDFLQLHFNADDIVTRPTHANSPTQTFTCKLRTLSVGSQPLSSKRDDILLVTFTILRIFPNVVTIRSSEGPSRRHWERVWRGVQLFRKSSKIIPPSDREPIGLGHGGAEP